MKELGRRGRRERTLATVLLFALALAGLACLSAPPALAASSEWVLALGGHDPVALCEGREELGTNADTLLHGRFIYRFTTAANRERFLADPGRWGIQNAGACGKMGVLSGAGSPRRWYVHDGRVYVFASDTCRERFRADPLSFVHRADPIPAPTEGEAERARKALDRAARAFGPSFDRLQSLELEVTAHYVGRDSSVSTAPRLYQWQFPGQYREHEEWSGVRYGFALADDSSFQFDGDTQWRHDREVTLAVQRVVWREPILLVRARREPGFVARWAGEESLKAEKVELVEVAFRGATTTLAIGKRTGRVLEARFPARTTHGDRPVVQRFSDFRAADGLELPHVSVRFEGGTKRVSPELRIAVARADVPLGPESFAPAN